MAIEVISAILVRDVQPLDGNYVRILPVTGHISIPAEERAAMHEAGATAVETALPPMRVVIWLWGGTSGERYTIAGQMHYQHGEVSELKTLAGAVWKDQPIEVTNIELGQTIHFVESGVARLRLFLNQVELPVVLAIPMVWSDHGPTGD